jgi:serine/threonine protein kinase/Tfp pilus assembly protein PilF
LSKSISSDTIIGHYRIVSKIGAGGMGEVYLAQDTRLDRKVALKILPADVAGNRDRMERFVREAKSAAALSHPNIAQIFEIGEHDGTHFIAMEYIEGVTLREKIHQERTELSKLLRFLQHAAEGLARAHTVGIVHRDLKPDNIMVTRDGHTKIVDFGLAKLIEQQPIPGGETGEAATAVMPQHSTPGTVMGTVGYMSPEQAQGKTNEIDQRSDIFSFGCILFEAVTGHKAFEGKDAIDSLNKIIREPAAPISDFRPDLPSHLQRIVRRCLAKDPEDRYQTIKDVAIELRELRHELAADGDLDVTVTPAAVTHATGEPGTKEPASQTAADPISGSTSDKGPSTSSHPSSAEYIVSGIKQHKLALVIALLVLVGGAVGLGFYLRTKQVVIESIAVMPFLNESGNADVEYLSDGMTETLINSLSQIPNLSVKARSSVFRYKGKEIDPKKIAVELNVQAILTGRVVQRGDQLTLNLELIDVQTENILWGNRYERKSSELIALQSEIARDVSNRLTKLSGADAAKVEKNYTANAEAYQLYLKGRFYGSKRTAKDAQKSIEYFQQAVAVDPKYALAYAGLAEANWFLALYSYPQVNEVVPKARELALKAIELDGSLAEPHSVLGIICNTYDHDFACMEREQKRALELNPNYSEGHRRYGLLLQNLGRFEEARIETKRALDIDPLSPVTNQQNAQLLFYERKYDESEAVGKKNIELDPNFWYAHWQLFYVYRQKRDYASAVEELAKVQEARGEPDAAELIRESFTSRDWLGFLKRITAERPRLKLYPYFVATFYAELGEKDKAFAMLNEAIETRDQHTGQMKVDAFMDPLRDDPRFREVLKRAGFPE